MLITDRPLIASILLWLPPPPELAVVPIRMPKYLLVFR